MVYYQFITENHNTTLYAITKIHETTNHIPGLEAKNPDRQESKIGCPKENQEEAAFSLQIPQEMLNRLKQNIQNQPAIALLAHSQLDEKRVLTLLG